MSTGRTFPTFHELKAMQSCLDLCGTLLVGIDADESVRLINRRGCQVLEYEEEEILGANWFDHFVPRQQREGARANFHRLLSGAFDPLAHFESAVQCRSGEERIISWHNVALVGGGVLSSGEDVTARFRAEAELRYRLSLEKALAGVSRLFVSSQGTDLIEAIRIMGQAVNAGRAFILQRRGNRRPLEYTHEWCAPGVESRIDQNPFSSAGAGATGDFWSSRLPQHTETEIRDADGPGGEEGMRALQAEGILSLLAIPIRREKIAFGFLGFADLRTRRAWLEHEIRILRIAAEMIANHFVLEKIDPWSARPG